MKKTGYAYFVESPRTIDDLMEPYPIEQETAYEIVKTVKLSGPCPLLLRNLCVNR